MAKLIFFDKDHQYQVDGEPIPSVSEVLRFMSREIYDSATQYQLNNAADRGTRIHKATEQIDRFGSCEITEDIESYIRAYIQFLRDHKPHWEKIEHAMYHPELMYAGTLDRVGIIGGKRTVVDIKSTSKIETPLVTAQVNGYAMMSLDPIEQVAVLQLKKDGTYRFRILEKDTSTFLAALTLHNALKKKPRRKKQEVANGTEPSTDSAE